jgi:hypothetical protein
MSLHTRHTSSPFHISLHARPEGFFRDELSQIAGRSIRQIVLPVAAMTRPLPITFEVAVEKLGSLPRLYVEPDGSFVWVSGGSDDLWQLDGMLWDRGEALQYVELKGYCSQAAWQQLIATLPVDTGMLLVQLIEHAVYLSESEFRRYQWPD